MANKYFDSDSYQRLNVLGFFGYISLVVIVVFLALLAGGGVEDSRNLSKLFLFAIPIFIYGIMMLLDKLLIREVDFTWFHDPQKGVMSSPANKFWGSAATYFFISFLFFAPFLFYFVFVQQTSFLGLEEYQVTETAQVVLKAEPATSGETTLLALLYSLYVLVIKQFVKNKAAFTLLFVLGALLIAGFMTVIHISRYSGDEAALTSVAFFFTLATIMLMLFGSLIPLLVQHSLSLIFQQFKVLGSNEYLLIAGIFIYIFMFFLFGFYIYSNRK